LLFRFQEFRNYQSGGTINENHCNEMISPFSLYSYAKVNLGLQIIHKRPDGYHEIETVMQTVDLTDTVTVSPLPSEIEVNCTDPVVPLDEQNLVYRAAQLLRERYEIDRGVRIDIQKQIPVAAGLAGGSGNGAVTLLALNRMWGLDLPERDLFRLGAELGSDIPFCMLGGTALATGRGEHLEPLDVQCPCVFVLATPDCQVSSAWAYQNLKIDLTNGKSMISLMLCALRQRDMVQLVSCMENDLEKSVLETFPIVNRVKQVLDGCGASGVLMSGSGPTVFGIVPDRKVGEQVAACVRQVAMDWRVFVTSPVSRAEILTQRNI